MNNGEQVAIRPLGEGPVIVAGAPTTTSAEDNCCSYESSSLNERNGGCGSTGSDDATYGYAQAGQKVNSSVQCWRQKQHERHRSVAAMEEARHEETNSSDGSDSGGGDDHGSNFEGEEKREVDWAPTPTKKFSPMAEIAPSRAVPGVDTKSKPTRHARTRSSPLMTRNSSLPLLSAGPYVSHHARRNSSRGLVSSMSRNELKQQEQLDALVSTPRTKGRGTGTATPCSRPRSRKMVPMLGMLQNAQDQAASPGSALSNISRYRSSSGIGAVQETAESSSAATVGGGDGTAAGNDHPAGHKRAPRRMSVGFGAGGGASRNATPMAAAAAKTGAGWPLLTPLSVCRKEAFDHEEATPLAGTTRRLRDKSVRFIQRLPGPKLLLQFSFLEEEMDPKNVRLTTQSEPIILMEVMPAALVVSLLALTYLFFAGGVVLIARLQLRGTSTLAVPVPAGTGAGGLCAAAGSSSAATATTNVGEGGGFVVGVDGPDPDSPSAAGCTVFSPGLSELSFDSPLLSSSSSLPPSLTDGGDAARYGAVFSGQFSGLTDISGSVSLYVSFPDADMLESLPDPATVDLALEACTGGATSTDGSSDGMELEWGTCEGGWQPVLFQDGISARVLSLPPNEGYTLFNFYQNQETIRGQALVRQYRVQVGFVSTTRTTTGTSSSAGENSGSSVEFHSGLREARWSLEYETGVTETWARIVLAAMLACWVPVWLAWCWTVFCQKGQGGFKNALPERKWLAFMGLSVALYLDPVMVVGNFVAPGSAWWGLASEMSLSVAVAVFLVVALCIADGVGKDRVGGGAGGSLGFYVLKVAFGVLTLALMLLVDLSGFPSITGRDRSSLLAVQNWPESERHAFVGVASARISMVMLWAMWMLCRIYISGRLLRRLPYVPNRYQQLSYRFFGLQAFLLAIVYVMFALWRLIDILNDDLGGNTVAAEFMLFIKTRQDHLGSVSIMCAYALQLLLLFLPSSFKESKLFRDIAVRFVYFEEQIPVARGKRRDGGEGRLGSQGLGQGRDNENVSRGGGFTPGDTPKTSPGDVGREDEEDKPLFCVETAAWLLELAWETYNDPVGFKNPNNYHFGVADFSRVGFELVEHIHNVEHDTHCFILKDVPRGRLVVAFRGSVGTKHWMDNLRFLQTEFNLDQMMPKGREHEAPKVLSEDIDVHAAEALHGVVAHLASTSEEEEEDDADGFEPEPARGARHESRTRGFASLGGNGNYVPAAAAAAAPPPSPAVGSRDRDTAPSTGPPSSDGVAPPPVPAALVNESLSVSPPGIVRGEQRMADVRRGEDGEDGGRLSIEAPAGDQSGDDGSKKDRDGGIDTGSTGAGEASGDVSAAAVAADVQVFLSRDGADGATEVETERRPASSGCDGGDGGGGGSRSNRTPTKYTSPRAMSAVFPSEFSTVSRSRAPSTTTSTRPDFTPRGSGGGGDDGSGGVTGKLRRRTGSKHSSSSGGSGRDGGSNQQQRTHPISPSGIRAILKGFSLLPWQFKDPPRDRSPWHLADRTKVTNGAAGGSAAAGTAAASGAMGDDDLTAANADGRRGSNSVKDEGGIAAISSFPAPSSSSSASASASASPAPSPSRPRGFRGSRWITSVGNLCSPRLVRSHSMTAVGDIEEGKGRWPLRRGGRGGGSSSWGVRKWATPRELFGGGAELFGGGGGGGGKAERTRDCPSRAHLARSASFDHAAMLEAKGREVDREATRREDRGGWGAPWRVGGVGMGLASVGGGWRGVQGGSPGVMEGLGRGLAKRTEDLVRGTEVGLDIAREAARRGLEAADNAAHVMGINRIPVLRQYLWGQVHTGFWNSYEAVRGEIHACVRKTVVDWLLSQDNPPDIKLYVTGHSMGGALATHCAMDLKLHTIDKIQARLGNFVRVRRTLMQRVMSSLPRRIQPHRESASAGGKAQSNSRGGGKRDRGMDETAGHQHGSQARPPPLLPSQQSPTPSGRGEVGPMAAGASAGGGITVETPVVAGGEGKGHNPLQGLASSMGKRLQRMRGAPPGSTAGAARRGSDDKIWDDSSSAFSASSVGGSRSREARGGGSDRTGGDFVSGAREASVGGAVEGECSADFTPAFANAAVARSAAAAIGDGALAADGDDSDNVGGGGGGGGGGNGAVHESRDGLGNGDHDGVGADGGGSRGSGTKVLRRVATHLTNVASALDPRNLMSSPALRRSYWGGEERNPDHRDVDGDGGGGGEVEAEEVSRGTVELHMVSFGAPRVGNSIYAARYNDVVPHSFRVVVDGDPVPGVPSWWYTHVGTKVLIDGRGRGSLIMDPSFVEKRFFVRSKRYVLSHLAEAYQAGLRGNLLQAVPPEFQKSMPAHWPFGIKAESSDSSSCDSSCDGAKARRQEEEVAEQQKAENQEEEEADTDSGGEGALPRASISARQNDMAQQAVDALNEADYLNRGQPFRLVPRTVPGGSLRQAVQGAAPGAGRGAAVPTPAAGVGGELSSDSGGGVSGGGRGRSGLRAMRGGGGGNSSGSGRLAGGVKRLFRLGGSRRDVAVMEEGAAAVAPCVVADAGGGSASTARGAEGPATATEQGLTYGAKPQAE